MHLSEKIWVSLGHQGVLGPLPQTLRINYGLKVAEKFCASHTISLNFFFENSFLFYRDVLRLWVNKELWIKFWQNKMKVSQSFSIYVLKPEVGQALWSALGINLVPASRAQSLVARQQAPRRGITELFCAYYRRSGPLVAQKSENLTSTPGAFDTKPELGPGHRWLAYKLLRRSLQAKMQEPRLAGRVLGSGF